MRKNSKRRAQIPDYGSRWLTENESLNSWGRVSYYCSIVTRGLRCTVFQIWPRDEERATYGPTSTTCAYLALKAAQQWCMREFSVVRFSMICTTVEQRSKLVVQQHSAKPPWATGLYAVKINDVTRNDASFAKPHHHHHRNQFNFVKWAADSSWTEIT